MTSPNPYRNVAIAAVSNSRQARRLDGSDSLSITLDAALSVLDTAGMDPGEVDGVAGRHGTALAYRLGIGPVWDPRLSGGVDAVLTVAAAVAAGAANVVLLADGEAGAYTDREAMAPWTRPGNEFVAPFGMFTAAEFALIARRHMDRHGTTVDQMAHVAATIRNNGSANPEAIYYGRGPFTPADIRSSRPIAEPFNLLDCATTSEGATALLITTAERAADLRCPPVYILGGGIDHFGPSYQHPAQLGPDRQHRRPQRLRRAPSGATGIRHRGDRTRRGGRLRVLRSVLVRADPTVRGVRLLRRGRRGGVRDVGCDRAVGSTPVDDGRRHDVLQPSGRTDPDAPAGGAWRRTDPGPSGRRAVGRPRSRHVHMWGRRCVVQ